MNVWKDFEIVGVSSAEDTYYCNLILSAHDGETFSVQCEASKIPQFPIVSVPYYWVGGDLLNFVSCGLTNPVQLCAMPSHLLGDITTDEKIPQIRPKP